MLLALLGGNQIGQGEMSPSDGVLITLVFGVFGKQGIEFGNGLAALDSRLGVLSKSLVNRGDAQVSPAHFVTDLRVSGIPLPQWLELLECVMQQVTAHGFGLRHTRKSLVRHPYQHLSDRGQGLACILVGALTG